MRTLGVILIALAAIGLVIGKFALGAWIIQLVYNHLIAIPMGLQLIGFWPAAGVKLLASFILPRPYRGGVAKSMKRIVRIIKGLKDEYDHAVSS